MAGCAEELDLGIAHVNMSVALSLWLEAVVV